MTSPVELRVVVFKEGDVYVAQCLEHDICTQADDAEELRERMECLIGCEMREAEASGQPIDAAPRRFHDMWDEGGQPADSAHQYTVLAA